MSRPHSSCETVFNSLYVALPVDPCGAVQNFLETFPTTAGRPIPLDGLHVSVVYGDEFAYPMHGMDEYRRLEAARASVAESIGDLTLEGAITSQKNPALEALGGAFWGISLPATEEFVAARKAAREVIQDRLGVALAESFVDDEVHVSMLRRRKTRGYNNATAPPTFYHTRATFTIRGEPQVDIVTTTSAAVERSARRRQPAAVLRQAV